MAKLNTTDDAVDPLIDHYDEQIHGPGTDGIRRWSRAAQDWLREDYQRRIHGMDVLMVIKEAIRLQGGYERGQFRL